MLEGLSLLAACGLSFVGFSVLALSQDRHWVAVTAMKENRRQRGAYLLAVGLTLQCLACPLMIFSQGAGFGALLWGIGMIGAAMSVAFILTWRPSWLLFVALVCQGWRWGKGPAGT